MGGLTWIFFSLPASATGASGPSPSIDSAAGACSASAALAAAGGLGGPAGVGATVGVETAGIGLGAFDEIAAEGGVATVGGACAGGVAGLTCFGALAAFSASSATDFS